MWPFLILGGSEAALWLSASLSVVAGAFASTAIGYALITDLTEVEERTGIFAVGAALMKLVGVLPKTLVAVVHIAMPRHLYAPCWCDFAMMILFLICAASIGSTSSKPTSEDTLEKSAFDDSGAGSDHPAEGAVALDNESFDDLEQVSAELSEDSENSPGTTFRDEPVDAFDLVRQTTLASTRRATHAPDRDRGYPRSPCSAGPGHHHGHDSPRLSVRELAELVYHVHLDQPSRGVRGGGWVPVRLPGLQSLDPHGNRKIVLRRSVQRNDRWVSLVPVGWHPW